jgi:hypothetical protein
MASQFREEYMNANVNLETLFTVSFIDHICVFIVHKNTFQNQYLNIFHICASFIIYYLLFIIYYLHLMYLLFIIYYLLFIIYYLLFIIYYLLFIIYYLII